MKNHCLFGIVLLALVSISASVSAQVSTSFVLCIPGGPGSTADAQPVVDRFLKQVNERVNLGTTEAAYYTDFASCLQQVRKAAANRIVMVPLDVYLRERQAWQLRSVVQVDTAKTSGQYHVVASKGETLASLQGKRWVTGLKLDAPFLSRIALDGAVVLPSDGFKKVRSSLSAIKRVAKGRADVVIVDDLQRKSMASLPIAKELAVIYSGPDLPEAIVAVAGKTPAKKLKKALLSLCQDHKSLCADLRITRFKSVDDKRLQALEKKLQP